MKLSLKVLIFVFLVVIPSVVITYFGSENIIKNSFQNIENDRSTQNVGRVLNALDESIDAQNVLAGDWANWDDAYQFARDKNKDFIKGNFADATFENAGLNFIAFYSPEGKLIHSRFYLPKEKREINTPEFLDGDLTLGKLILKKDDVSNKHGLISTPQGPLIVTAHQVFPSNKEGPSSGTLIMAKYLNENMVKEIGVTTKLNVKLQNYDDTFFTGNSDTKLSIRDNQKIIGYGKIKDIYGNPVYMFNVEMDRNITQQGGRTILYFLYYLIAVSIVGAIGSNLFIKRVILKPLSTLVKDLGAIAQTGSFSGRVSALGDDEFGFLSKDINLTLEALSENQRRLSTLMSNLPGMAYTCVNDKDWTMKFVSRGALSLTGYTPEEIMDNKTVSYGGLIHPEDQKMVWDEVQKAVAQQRPFLLVYRIITKDKETKWVWEQGREVDHPNGEKFLEGFINDITAQKSAEIELVKQKSEVEKTVDARTKELKEAKEKISQGWLQIQQEKAKLVSSINSLALGFVITDGKGNIIMTNPAINKIFNEADATWTFESLQAVLGTQYNLKEEIDICLKDPSKCTPKTIEVKSKFVKVTICPITALEKEGETFGVVIVFEDTTQAKIMERSRDEFFSIASHELRTPLTAIRGNTSLIKDYYGKDIAKNPDLSEMVDDMHDSSVRLISIVNDFLDASRLEMDKMQFNNQNIDMVDLTEKVVKDLGPIATEKKLDLIFEKPKEKLTALADSDRVRQVITNLLGNSLNYTKAGSVKIELSGQDGFVKVRVVDTGVGISDENKVLLFKKFQQAQEKTLTRDVTRGTGMGLYISRMLAVKMGGDVVLENSEVGKGSTFTFSIPSVK